MRIRPLALSLIMFAVATAPAADPAKLTKADLEKQIKDGKSSMEKAAKDLEPFKKDKEIGALVTKHMDARAKFLEARLKQAELQSLPNYTAAVEKQDTQWGEVATKKFKESGDASDAIKKVSEEKAKAYLTAFSVYDEAQVAVQGAQIALFQLKADGKK